MAIAEELITLLGYDLKGTDKLRQYERGNERALRNATRTDKRAHSQRVA